MSTKVITVATTTIELPPTDMGDGIYGIFATSMIASNQGSRPVKFLLQINPNGDKKRIDDLMEKYQTGSRFLIQGKPLFTQQGNPIIREDNNQVQYAAHDLQLQVGHPLGSVPAGTAVIDYVNMFMVVRMTRDPENRYTTNGKAITSFSVVSDKFVANPKAADGSGFDKFPLWWRCTAWGEEAAESILNKNLHKGDLVLVEGQPSPSDDGFIKLYEKKDGTGFGSSYDVWINYMSLTKVQKSAGGTGGGSHQVVESDEIPF